MEKVLQQQADQLIQQTKHLREIERHASTDKVVQAAQVFTAYRSLKDSDKLVEEINDLTDKLEKGLLDKTGEGLNSNVIKLADYIKKSARGQLPRENSKPQPANEPVTPPSKGEPIQSTKPNRADDTAAGRDQASKYQMGATGYLKNLFNVKQGEKGTKAVGAGIKNMFKLENIFDLSEGKSQGLLGQTVRRQVAKNEFIDTQVATGATANRDLAAKRFEVVNKQRGVASDAQKSIAKYEAQGLTPEQIERTGEYQTIVDAEKKIRTADPLERERRVAVPVTPAVTVAPISPVTPAVTPAATGGNVIPFPLSPRNIPGSTKETESENLRLMQEQTDAIRKIEENTRPLGDLVAFLGKKDDKEGVGSQGGRDQGGGLFDSIGDFFRNSRGGRGRGGRILRRAKVLAGRAGQVVSRGATAVASRAAPIASSLISGVSNLASKAAPVLSTVGEAVGGVGSKVAGVASKVAPAAGGILKGAGRLLGKAALPLAAGVAIYDGVTGYKDAAENLDIKDREATLGEKLSSAGGSIASGLTFGLLDKKMASKGIASFFGAGPDKDKTTPVEGEQGSNLITGAKDSVAEFFYGPKESKAVMGAREVDKSMREAMDIPGQMRNKMSFMADAGSKEREKEVSKFRQNADYKAMSPEQRDQWERDNSAESWQKKVADLDKADKEAQAVKPRMGKEGIFGTRFGRVAGESELTAKKMESMDTLKMDAGQKSFREAMLGGFAPLAPSSADQVAGKSAENVAAKEQSSTIAPVVINAPQNTSVQQTQNYAPKSPPRNTESSVQQYNRSRFAY